MVRFPIGFLKVLAPPVGARSEDCGVPVQTSKMAKMRALDDRVHWLCGRPRKVGQGVTAEWTCCLEVAKEIGKKIGKVHCRVGRDRFFEKGIFQKNGRVTMHRPVGQRPRSDA